jgi:manganese transport protein
MTNKPNSNVSLSEVHETIEVHAGQVKWRQILAFFGPAYLVSVGYMDPGNWATDLAGGSKFGYKLIWVLLMSNLMALLLQGLSARLGIVRRRDLAQANREAYPRPVNLLLYVLAEVAIAATDLAEVLGMAIGLQLLTGLPLIWGVAITVLDTFLLLFLQRKGMRKMEAFIIALVAVVGISFLIEIILAKPNAAEIATGFLPSFPNEEALYIAIGIIGATVMPHNLYLHSALVQTRKIARTAQGIKQALKWNRIDSTIALNIAFLVNSAILILAATVFYKNGQTVVEIKEAYKLLPGFLGTAIAAKLFAIALIAAGQSSTITGTLAGQIVMEGYLQLRINPLMRRLLTRLLAIVPAIFVIYYFGESRVDSLLILSQVILSMQLGFAIIPLIHFVSDKQQMGEFVIKNRVRILAWIIAFVLVFLNVKMVINEASDYFAVPGNTFWKFMIILGGLTFGGLLVYILFFPLFKRKKKEVPSVVVHEETGPLGDLRAPQYNRIAVALDFSKNDEKLLRYAIGQGNNDTQYILIHIVESASAKMLGKESGDYETEADEERLALYVDQLKQKGIIASSRLGFHSRTKEIVRLVIESSADMLVIGAHGHTGVKDWFFGETINSVRHELKIPVLIVNI